MVNHGRFQRVQRVRRARLAELVRTGQVRPSELVEDAIGRIETLNPQLNAVIHKMYELAREMAKGDLPDGPL